MRRPGLASSSAAAPLASPMATSGISPCALAATTSLTTTQGVQAWASRELVAAPLSSYDGVATVFFGVDAHASSGLVANLASS